MERRLCPLRGAATSRQPSDPTALIATRRRNPAPPAQLPACVGGYHVETGLGSSRVPVGGVAWLRRRRWRTRSQPYTPAHDHVIHRRTDNVAHWRRQCDADLAG